MTALCEGRHALARSLATEGVAAYHALDLRLGRAYWLGAAQHELFSVVARRQAAVPDIA